jgi:hypothetical protein
MTVPPPSRPDDKLPILPISLGAAAVAACAILALQIATGWPLGPRSTGPALYGLTIIAAVLLAFCGGENWARGAAEPHRGPPARETPMGVLHALAPPALAALGLWLGARNGLLVIAAGLALLWLIERTVGAHAIRASRDLRTRVTLPVMLALLAAALLGPF